MKSAFALLALCALALTACKTIVNRRDEYRPARGEGPYSKALRDGTWKDGVKTPATPEPTAKPKL